MYVSENIMNGSQENNVEMLCKVTGSSLVPLKEFPNNMYELNQIAILVMNGMLIFSTISLNGISVITIRKSSQLRSKICYFIILLQSIIDLSVGVLTIPLFIYYLIVPFLNTANCTLVIFAVRTLFLPMSLSISTLSAMTLERYIGVLHPFQYKTKVTKKRILIYVCGLGLSFISAISYSFRSPAIVAIYTRGWICVLFALTAFVYTRIYLVIRKLIRSEGRPAGESDGSQVRKQIIRESRRARSCFLVILCFFILLLPVVFSRLAFIVGTVDYTVYYNWSLTMFFLNSSISSVIFFWTKTLLRKEALKTLNYLGSEETSV